MIIVSHDLKIIEEYSDRAFCINRGGISFKGGCQNVIKQYLTLLNDDTKKITGQTI